MSSLNMSILAANYSYQEIPTYPESIGNRLLEVLATKLFGNPMSYFAFSNNIDYFGIQQTDTIEITTPTNPAQHTTQITERKFSKPAQKVSSGMYSSFSTSKFDFYNAYIASGRVTIDELQKQIAQDNSRYTQFNMTSTEIDIPMFYTGSLIDSVGGPLSYTGFFATYTPPNVGGSRINTTDGTYNVPLILRLHD
jgi:hypothetical protein